jgi:translin
MTDSKLSQLNKKFTNHFDGVDSAREDAIKLGRDISKRSSAIVRKLHGRKSYKKTDKPDLNDLIAELDDIKLNYKTLKKRLQKYPEIFYSNMVENFIQEYVETTVMLNLLSNNLNTNKLPDPDGLGIRYSTYLLGLSDVIGELRRCTLNSIKSQCLSDAELYLETMEKLFDVIINLNYPDGVLPLRRKQDVSRSLIEKTRGELAFAASEYSLKENISELRDELSRYYKNVARKN